MSFLDKLGGLGQKLQILAALLPLISGLVQQVENMFPQQGVGAQKLEMVRRMLESVYATLGEFTVAFTDIWPVLKGAIEAVVNAANALGLFKKPGTVQPIPPPPAQPPQG